MHLAQGANESTKVEEALARLRRVDDRPIQDLANAFIGATGTHESWFSDLVRFAASETATRPAQTPDPASPSLDTTQDDFERQQNLIHVLAHELIQDSIPFSSDHYWAHMNWDTLMVSMAAIAATLPLNPNQVAAEGSPATTALEIEVGSQLCEMLGYPLNTAPVPWGHLTSDGSVANIEALWTARNLKLYPTAVAEAVRRDLRAARRISVEWRGTNVRLLDLTAWQLLNLSPKETVSLPKRLKDFYEEDDPRLAVIRGYTVQHLGLLRFAKRFNKARLGTLDYLAPATAHYSLPKGSSLLGLGDIGMVRVPVDRAFRMDIDRLTEMLDKRLRRKRPVLAVIAVIGNTEHGAIDPLQEIIDLRDSYRTRGLDFYVHADAAYGGYFASMLRPHGSAAGGVLNRHAETQLSALGQADSVTVDPHKSGYVPYPAGAICYRDERMPEMIAWRDPVVFHSKHPTTGSFTLEGSRPGTAAAAVWAAHKSVPLDQSGYGRLHTASIQNSLLVRSKLKSMADDQSFSITMLFGDDDQDLNIMSYAFNPRDNRDPARANKVNDAIYARLAIEYKGDPRPPVIITGSKLDPAEFGRTMLRKLRSEMGVNNDPSPLSFLISTIMNPFLEEGTVDRLIAAMRIVVAEECAR